MCLHYEHSDVIPEHSELFMCAILICYIEFGVHTDVLCQFDAQTFT